MTTAGPCIALVTGAGRRVGQAVALDLAARGWGVAVHHYGSADGARETVARIRAEGGIAHAFRADLASGEGPATLVDEVVAMFGALDALVSSAASMVRTPLGGTSAADVDAIVALNLRAPFLLAQAAAPRMRDGGAVVLIGDHMATEPWPGFAVHGVSKAGLEALTRHLAAALAPRLRVNAVAPGLVLAPEGMDAAAIARFVAETPLGRIGTPADVAQAVAYLLEAGFVTGEVLHVDGGRRVRR